MENITTTTGWNEHLEAAVSETDIEHVRAALDNGADPNVTMSSDSIIPLYWAVNSGSLDIVVLLLSRGALVAKEADADETTMHHAAESNNVDMLRLLLRFDGGVALNWFDYIDRTPLMCAVQAHAQESAAFLIDAGSDVNAHNEPRIGDSALHIAVEKGDLAMVELLLKAGANPKIEGWMRITPLDKARAGKRGDRPRILDLIEQAARRF
jgi:ankyrin repeat protein